MLSDTPDLHRITQVIKKERTWDSCRTDSTSRARQRFGVWAHGPLERPAARMRLLARGEP